jgi:hypothetical protein
MMQKSTSTRGFWHFLTGFSIIAIIRPHIALMLAIAMAGAYFWGVTRTARGSVPMKILRVTILVAIIAGLYPLTLSFLGLSGTASTESMEEFMRANGEANARAGGSVVEVQVAPGLGGMIRALPRGVVRVLLEPFPWEVRNVNSALAAAENLFIAALLISYSRRIMVIFRAIARVPYFLFSSFLTVGLLLLFSFLPNLGLLSRQRVQMLPFLFGVLVAPASSRRRESQSRDLIPVPHRIAVSAAPRALR